MRQRIVLLLVAVVVLVVGVGLLWQFGPWRTGDGADDRAGDTSVPVPEDVASTVLAAGDIATCEGSEHATGQLLAEHDGVVAALGDLAYPDGSTTAFAECYDPAWGPLRDRTRPTLGNHDVEIDGGAPYHDYFDGATGGRDGWYGYDLGPWHVVVLNSNCDVAGGCGAESPQVTWLREHLAGVDTGNILAYWHAPRFSTGQRSDSQEVAAFWEVLHEAGADVVLAAHAHNYQRFAPLAPDGDPDPDGIRQFVVGTGGAPLRGFDTDDDRVAHREADRHGILRLDLHDCGYDWAFLPVNGDTPLDEGTASGTC